MPKRYRVMEERHNGAFGGQQNVFAIVSINNPDPVPAGAVEVPGDTSLHGFRAPVDADFPENKPAPAPLVIPDEPLPATAPKTGEGE